MNEAASSKPEWALGRRERLNAQRAARGLPPKRARWPWVLLLAAIAAAGVGGYHYLAADEPAGAAAPPAPAAEILPMQIAPGEVETVARRRLLRKVKVTGSLSPLREAQLSAEVAGRIETVRVRTGDAVEAGDVLVEFDKQTLEIQLRQQRATADATRAQLELANQELERATTLIERNVGPASGLEQAQASVDQLRATLAGLEAQVQLAENALREATVLAPFDGWVSERAVDPGQAVTIGTPLLTLVDLSSLEFEAAAPLASIPAIARGQKVVISVEGVPKRTFEGTVERISPVAQEGTRTLPVFISLGNTDGVLRGGMFATGEIVVDARDDAMSVPTLALREDQEGSHVLEVEGGRVLRQPVRIVGYWDGGLAEIVSGLSEGDTVISAPLPEISPGDAVVLLEERP